MTKYDITVEAKSNGLRLDQAIGLLIPEISRTKARKLITLGGVWLNGNRTTILSKTVSEGDMLQVYEGRDFDKKQYEIDPLNIIYEDDWLICYRKEPGIPSQGIICDNYNNIYAALFRYLKKKNPASYLAIHQRLDIGTSGVMLFSKSKAVNRNIHFQFKNNSVLKKYMAFAEGNLDFQEKTIINHIGRKDGRYYCADSTNGKEAITLFKRIRLENGFTILEAIPGTGRTHQIRLQLSNIGHPILGDKLYGDKNSLSKYPRTMLHAASITVEHPVTKKELVVEAALFDDMKSMVELKG